jgi:hypothetical protein
MAYSGTTAGTTLRNPYRLTAGGGLYTEGTGGSSVLSTAPQNPNAQGAQLWSYCSTNKTTDLNAGTAKTVTDGYYLGMRPGDVAMVTQFTSAGSSVILSFHVVATVNATAGTAVLSTGAIISSTYS